MAFLPTPAFFIALSTLLTVFSLVNWLPATTAAGLLLLAVVLWGYKWGLQARPRLALLAWSIAVPLAIALVLYRPAGFNYPLVFSLPQLHPGGKPFSLYVNMAKALAGLAIVYFLLALAPVGRAYIQRPWQHYALAFGMGLGTLGVAVLALPLQFHSKPWPLILAFAGVNIAVTCIAEEAFMRLLLQAQLQRAFATWITKPLWQEALPLIITTLLFVALHPSAPAGSVWAFALAGWVYGLVYCLTKNVWACVAVHFTVNLVHFAFFTYPLG